MGGLRIGCVLMTGIGAILAGDSSPSISPPPPLYAAVTYSGGGGPFYVSGASGNMIDNYSPARAFVYTYGGGTPPYTTSVQLLNDPSGKLSIVGAGSPIPKDTLAWSGFSLSEAQGCYIQFDLTDSLGATASARYPATGVIVLQRTS